MLDSIDVRTAVFGGIALVAATYAFMSKKAGGATGSRSILTSFTRDLTDAAAKGTLSPVVGRESEIARAIEILSRRTKNNPLLLGEPGVGKTAIAEGLALKIVQGDVPQDLRGKRVLALDLVGLMSDTKYRGEFEKRLKSLVDEIVAAHRNVILFIDEVHMLAQAKGAEGSLNIADVLKPALARGEMQVVGATTPEEYDVSIRPDETLDRRFQPILVPEPSHEETMIILRGIRDVYGKYHRVTYTDDALKAAIDLSVEFAAKRFLPDRAIDLIDEAGARVKIESSKRAEVAARMAFRAGEQVRNKAPDPAHVPEVTEDDIRRIVDEWKS